jgi:L-ribulokinase
MMVSRSAQTCALGAAVAAAVVAGAHPDFASAIGAMTGLKSRVFKPDAAAHDTYRQLYSLYSRLHDAFGKADWQGSLYPVMKQLIDLRQRARV